ncbi:hypothetical protein LCGC14_0594260 [marine sediment metagenome]|uniref:Uncharacterized protein n=1 Tax=marine sediment metagenome TaxID=412755 RepID=A0A0F9RHE9_9ZZZZ
MPDQIDIGKYLSSLYGDYSQSRGRKETMFGEGISALQSYADIFKPGGTYGAGTEAAINRAGTKAVASGYQNLVSAGLSNTTVPGGLQATFEEEVGIPARLRSEDRRMELLGGATSQLASAYTNYNPLSPSAGDIAHLATGGFSGIQTGRIADMNAQLAANAQNPYPFGRFEDQFGSSGGGGTSGGGGGTAPTTSQHLGAGGFSNPYGGGSGDGGFAGGELPVMVGGQRVDPGTDTAYSGGMSQQEYKAANPTGYAEWWDQMQRASAFGRPIPPKPWETGGDVFAPSTAIDDPFADYASRISGVSAYI